MAEEKILVVLGKRKRRNGMTKKKKPGNKNPSFNDLVKTIGNLAVETQKIAEQYGLFLNHRALLECQCGLEEDVTMEGKLIVCRKGAEGVDVGLRFPEPNIRGKSRCPGCGRVVVEMEL